MKFSKTPKSPLDSLSVARVFADVDGYELTAQKGGVGVLRVEVELELGRPGSFLVEAADLTSDDLDWADNDDLQEGAPITISMGWTETRTPVFVGEVLGIDLEIAGDKPPMTTLRGYDRLHRLARARKTRAFVTKRDSEIADDLAREHGMRVAGPQTPVVHPYVMQADQTDLAFLLARARPLGYIVRADDTELIFAPRYVADDPLITATLGENLLEFFASATVLGLSAAAEARGWDPAAQKALVARASKLSGKMGFTTGLSIADGSFGAQTTSVQGAPIVVADDAAAAAAAELEDMALGHVTCEGKMLGNAALRPGTTLGLSGVGVRFSGAYYLTRVVHKFDKAGYTTEFAGRRTAT